MAETDKLFAGSVPETYERYLVPLIFEPYAQDLAARVAALAPGLGIKTVLETAAGTGVLTRALAALLPAAVRIVATDLNPPMLAEAQRRLADARVEWRPADALALPFAERGFDVVACQFGAMFFPDRIEGYREARRVLAPGGRFLFSVWDRIAANEFADVVTDALAALFPHDPPRFLARTPHGYHDVARIRADVAAAGFAGCAIEPVEHTSRAASARAAAIAYCEGTPLRNEIEARDPSRLAEATARAADALARRFGSGSGSGFESGAIEGRVRALVVTATP